jgi:sialidase-1
VYTPDGIPTNYTVGSYGRLYKNGQPCGSICHGENRELRQADVSFLQLIESHDRGETWSEPVDLNFAVKAPWMRFVGAGPGTGIRLRKGPHRGRLLFPVYYHNQNKVASSGAI